MPDVWLNPKTPGHNRMYQACGDFQELRHSLDLVTASWQQIERIAFTHALRCPTCTAIAEESRAQTKREIRELEKGRRT